MTIISTLMLLFQHSSTPNLTSPLVKEGPLLHTNGSYRHWGLEVPLDWPPMYVRAARSIFVVFFHRSDFFISESVSLLVGRELREAAASVFVMWQRSCVRGRWLSGLACSRDEEKWWFRFEEFPQVPRPVPNPARAEKPRRLLPAAWSNFASGIFFSALPLFFNLLLLPIQLTFLIQLVKDNWI